MYQSVRNCQDKLLLRNRIAALNRLANLRPAVFPVSNAHTDSSTLNYCRIEHFY